GAAARAAGARPAPASTRPRTRNGEQGVRKENAHDAKVREILGAAGCRSGSRRAVLYGKGGVPDRSRLCLQGGLALDRARGAGRADTHIVYTTAARHAGGHTAPGLRRG